MRRGRPGQILVYRWVFIYVRTTPVQDPDGNKSISKHIVRQIRKTTGLFFPLILRAKKVSPMALFKIAHLEN